MVGRIAALTAASLSLVAAQQIGHTPESHPRLTTKQCTAKYGCQTVQNAVVIDASSRPLIDIQTGKSCYLNGALNPEICTTEETCADRCALEGINYAKNGVTTSGNSLRLQMYEGSGSSIRDVTPRVYLLDAAGNGYDLLKLTNQELRFTVDVSNLPCGMNGALYLSEMDKMGGLSKMNPAGAQYGTGYCDAQCFDTPLINGVANLAGKGACCMEMDIWEANQAANQLTPHPCNVTGLYECTGELCTNNGVCDQDGCGYNAYGIGAHNFYGTNSSFTVDTSKTFSVVTQFMTDNGKATGNLNQINRMYIQNDVVIAQAGFTLNGEFVNSITPEYCADYESWNTRFPALGGMPMMGQALERGMVLIFSIWNTNAGNMSWLDTGSAGPCNVLDDSGSQIEADDPTTYVTFSDIRVGEIGSTY